MGTWPSPSLCRMRGPRLVVAAVAVAVAASAALLTGLALRTEPPSAPQLTVRHGTLVNAAGKPVVLRGVNVPGGEYACVQAGTVWAGPADRKAVTAIRRWGVTAVRVPLNSACWNGSSYVAGPARGTPYRTAVRTYVNLLLHNGLTPVLDLHWSEGRYTGPDSRCASARATCLKPMPDAAGSVPFWRSVAREFGHDRRVVLDLFNEPFPDRALNGGAAGWSCWRDGGDACARGIPGYRVAGMRELVDTVRATDARNVLLLSGLTYGNDLTQWLRHAPADPLGNLAAAWHAYDFNPCRDKACWEREIAPVAAQVPLVTAEFGQGGCRDDFVGPLMRWLDRHHTGYLAWAWAPWSCAAGPALITGYQGTPTRYGEGVRTHLLVTTRK